MGPRYPYVWLAIAAGTRNLTKGDNMTRFIVLFLIAGTALLAGCNTVAGAGEDISKGGQALHNSAEQAK
jgi:entericidin B